MEYRTINFNSHVEGDLERLNRYGLRGWRVVAYLGGDQLLLERKINPYRSS